MAEYQHREAREAAWESIQNVLERAAHVVEHGRAPLLGNWAASEMMGAGLVGVYSARAAYHAWKGDWEQVGHDCGDVALHALSVATLGGTGLVESAINAAAAAHRAAGHDVPTASEIVHHWADRFGGAVGDALYSYLHADPGFVHVGGEQGFHRTTEATHHLSPHTLSAEAGHQPPFSPISGAHQGKAEGTFVVDHAQAVQKHQPYDGNTAMSGGALLGPSASGAHPTVATAPDHQIIHPLHPDPGHAYVVADLPQSANFSDAVKGATHVDLHPAVHLSLHPGHGSDGVGPYDPNASGPTHAAIHAPDSHGDPGQLSLHPRQDAVPHDIEGATIHSYPALASHLYVQDDTGSHHQN